MLFLYTARFLKRDVYLEIQERIQLVLNGRQSFNQLLCVHGAHHTLSPAREQEHMHANRQTTHMRHLVKSHPFVF